MDADTPTADSPVFHTTPRHDLPCTACGTDSLTVVGVHTVLDSGRREAGGWAHCLTCDATPHPNLDVSGRPEPPTEPLGFVTLTGGFGLPCPDCGLPALGLVVVSLHFDAAGYRDAGGFAHCRACDATPHPTLKVPHGR